MNQKTIGNNLKVTILVKKSTIHFVNYKKIICLNIQRKCLYLRDFLIVGSGISQ